MVEKDLDKELRDIFPSVHEYLEAKKEFKNHAITQSGVDAKLEKVVHELQEFLVLLNSYSTNKSETEILKRLKLNI